MNNKIFKYSYRKDFRNNGYLLLKNYFNEKEAKTITNFANNIEGWDEKKGKWMTFYEKRNDLKQKSRVEYFTNYDTSLKYFLNSQITSLVNFIYEDKMNLFNQYESPWEGTRVAKKKDLNSIDFMRQKVRSKNLKYSFLRVDKERNIETFDKGGWHFNNIMSPEKISLKLKTFAHTEFSSKEFSSVDVIEEKIIKKIDLFNRGHNYQQRSLDNTFPEYLIKNVHLYKEWIL